jgi:cell division protein FtsB
MLTKTKRYLRQYDFSELRETRTLVMLVFLGILLLMTWSGVKAIQTNYNLQKQITDLSQQNQLQALSNDNLRLQNQYYNTSQYLELAARQSFGLGAPGETELLVPPTVATAHLVPVPMDTAGSAAQSVTRPRYQRNFQAWLDFLLHRQSAAQ